MSPALRTRLSLWLPVLAWAALIFAVSSLHAVDSGLGTWDLILRKLAHAAEYAILAALLFRAIGRSGLAWIGGVAYAVSDEVHQHFVPGRHGAPRDVLIDSAGALIGVALAAHWRPEWRSARS